VYVAAADNTVSSLVLIAINQMIFLMSKLTQKLKFAVLITLLVSALTPVTRAQSSQPKAQIRAAIKHDSSRPLRDIKINPRTMRTAEDSLHDPEEAENQQATAKSSIVATITNDVVLQQSAVTSFQPTLGLNFDGIGTNSWAAPDADGAVGATQFVQYVNAQFAVYSKSTGAKIFGPAGAVTLWSGFGGACESRNDGDGIVQYDKAANRWVFTHHAVPAGGPYVQCVAVSTTSDATGSYNRYAFSLPNGFPDYPKMGVWPDAYYFSFNELNPTSFVFLNALVCAVDRNAMLSGAAATSVCFQVNTPFSTLLPADLDGSAPPPAGAPSYYLNLDTNSLDLWQFHVDFQTPSDSSFTGPVNIPVASFTKACGGGVCIPQLGTPQLVDSVADRLMYRLAYRNFGSYDVLVVNHSVTAGAGNVGVRWYEIRNPGSTPTVFQQGTFAPDSNYRWMGSVAMDQMGDMAIGYSVSSSGMNPAIAYTGRVPADPLGTMGNEVFIIHGPASEDGSNRWGDYTSMALDPVDDCTFWYTNQYFKVNGFRDWSTRIASFKFPSCPGVILSPLSLSFGNQGVGTESNGEAVTLNNKQTGALTISSIGTVGDFNQSNNCGSSVPAGGSCTITVTFAPNSTGSKTGTLIVHDDAANSPQSVSLTGTGVDGSIAASPTSMSFAAQSLNTSSNAKKLILTNTGAVGVTISDVSTSGNYAETDNCAGITLPASATCTINVTFTPGVLAVIPGIITVSSTALKSPQIVTLSGQGIRPVALSPATLAFGTVSVGSSSTAQTATLTNNLSTPITLSFFSSGGYSAVGNGAKPCATSLAAKSTCTIAVTFSPTINGSQNGALTASFNGSFSPQEVSLTGTGSGGIASPLIFSPASLTFNGVVIGKTSAAKIVTVSNTSNSSINISSFSASGAFNASGSGTIPCGGLLGAGSACSFLVTFSPTLAATVNAAVTINDDSSVSPQIYNLTGTGVLPVTLSPSSIVFPVQAVGTTSSPQIVTLTNKQNSALTINLAVTSNYALSSAGSKPCGASIAALGQCTLSVVFSPTATGNIPGVVTVSYSGNSGPQEIALSGTAQ